MQGIMAKQFWLAVVLLAAVATIGWTPPTWAGADRGFGRYHALVIGNNKYQHLPNLKTAVNDASVVADMLREAYDFEVELLLNASRYEIVTALNTFRRQLTENDNLLIYYAGHGILDEDSAVGYWLPADAEEENVANWISNATITPP